MDQTKLGENLKVTCFTPAGRELAGRIRQQTGVEIRSETEPLSNWVREYFRSGTILLFIGAAGIAVRSIAPYITRKDQDPAVLVMDEAGQYVVPLLSGHLGGANEAAMALSALVGAAPVLTTATDVNRLFAVDLFAKQNDLVITDLSKVKKVSAALLRKEQVTWGIAPELAPFVKISGPVPKELRQAESLEECWETSFVITLKQLPDRYGLSLIPKCIVAGMGCRRGKEAWALADFLTRALGKRQIAPEALCALASIDRKADEAGLLELAEKLQIPFSVFSSDELNAVKGNFSESDLVRRTVGVGNVCERAAVCAGAEKILVPKTAENGMTVALGIRKVDLVF